ncbi:bacteriophage lambda tail assembly I family protein, partial [Escherichia coli B49-2]
MLYSNILAHARRCAPAESCGFVVRTPEGERYFPCVNISGEPEDYFRMSPEDWLRAEMQGEIVALVHSHPGGLPWLSEADRRLQIKSALPWWLVCRGDIHKFRCVPHLTGRRFEHGVTDCYTLFRDAYHLAGTDMPDFEREDDWWRNGQNLYLDNMEATGFYRISLPSAQPGDILLCCFGASVANHAAIYCGNGELLHHLPEQLSKRERYSEKWQRRTHSLASPPLARSAFTGISTIWPPPQPVVNTAAEAIRALSLQMPGFRRQMNEGWYQIRIPTASQNRSPAPVFVV